MNKSSRREKILQLLENSQTALVSQLSAETGASMVTIRHDLEELEREGKLIRSHGGAILRERPAANRISLAPLLPVPQIPDRELKEAVAQGAIPFLNDDDTIFIGGGTTFYLFARLLKTFPNLKIVTTNLSAACELSPYNCNIYFIGGELVEMNGIVYTGGPKLPLELDKVFVNKAFIGVSGLDLNVGLTIYDLSQLSLYTCARRIAQQVFLLCDYTKFGYQSAHKIGPAEEIVDTIVTNHQVDPRYPQEMARRNIRFITV